MYRYCAACFKRFPSVEKLRDHVGLQHKDVEFSIGIQGSYIVDVVGEWCGGAQRWETVLVSELARVYGRGSRLAYHGPDFYQPLYGEVKTVPKTYYEALVRACFDDDKMLEMDDGMDGELSEMANQVD